MADQQPTLASVSASETNSLAASSATPTGPIWNCYHTHHKLSDRVQSARWTKRLIKDTGFQAEEHYDRWDPDYWVFTEGELAMMTSVNEKMRDFVAEKVNECESHQYHHSQMDQSEVHPMPLMSLSHMLTCHSVRKYPVIGSSESQIQRTQNSIQRQTVVSHIPTKAGETADG